MFYLVSILQTSHLGHGISDNTEQLFRRGEGGVEIHSSFCNKRPDSQNVRSLLLIKKKNRDFLPDPAFCGCQRKALCKTGKVPSISPRCLSDQNTGDQLMLCGQWSNVGLPRGRWEPRRGREGPSWWLRSREGWWGV